VRLRALELLGQLAKMGLDQLLGVMVALSDSVLAHARQEGGLRPEEGLATHATAKLWRLLRLRRIARWIPMLIARIKANPLLCLARPAPRPAPAARSTPRRPPPPVESPAGFARLSARLDKMLSLLQDPTRDDARALERALARRGVAGIIVGFCRDLGIDVAPVAALFVPPWEEGSPLEDLLPDYVSIAEWLAREVEAKIAALPAAGGTVPEPAAASSPGFSLKA
jgi:hypothetical protein